MASPQETLGAGTPNYGGTYTPFDSVQYYNQEAQLKYERMRMQMALQQQRLQETTLTGSRSVKNLLKTNISGTEYNEVYNRASQESTYQDDLLTRTMGMPVDAYQSVGTFAAEMLGGEMIERTMVRPMMRAARLRSIKKARAAGKAQGLAGRALTEYVKKRSMGGLAAGALSMGLGFGTSMVAMEALNQGLKFTGAYHAFQQFENIDEVRELSEMFGAGTATDPFTDRLGRETSKGIYDWMKQQDIRSAFMKDTGDLEDIKREAAKMSEMKLLEGVRDAEEFGKKFSEIKGAVKKITETLGKTFEEGVELMGDFRRMGVRPAMATGLINNAQSTALRTGIGFDRAHASGLRTALGMQGTGMTMGAGYQLGAFAAGMGQHLQQTNVLSDRVRHNLGGEEGIVRAIERGTMAALQSPAFTASMMASFKDGTFHLGRFLESAGGGSMYADLEDMQKNIQSGADILEWQAAQPRLASKLLEDNPAVVGAAVVRPVVSSGRVPL